MIKQVRFSYTKVEIMGLLLLGYAFSANGLQSDQASYKDAAQKCDQEVQARMEQISKDYVRELADLMDTFRLRGDLEKALAVRKEIERFETGKSLEPRYLVEIPIQLRELQQKFLAAPKKAADEIAKGKVATLEETKRKLTIDGKLDDAIVVKAEIDKILKKYGVVNPAGGSEFRSQDLPRYVRMTRSISLPTIVDGQQVGYTGIHEGQTYRLVNVDGPKVTIRVADSDVVLPVDATDLLARIERKQKGVSEEENAEIEYEHQPASDRLGRVWYTVQALAWDWKGVWKRRGTSVV